MTFTETVITTYVDPDISAAMVVYERLQPLQDALGLANLTVLEMQLFAMVASHTGLDPFTRQIYAIKRGGKVTHQTGIDGYRSTAERTGQYRGTDEATYEPCACGDSGSPPEHPILARVVVYRAYPDGIRPQVGVARWHELKPKHVKNQSGYGYGDDMWWEMPYNQLAKCAEANGLRKAFPRVLGGVYISEEMDQAGAGDNAALIAAASQPTVAERVHARRGAIEQTPIEGEVVEPAEAIDTPPQTPQDAPAVTEPDDASVAESVSGGCQWGLEARDGSALGCELAEMHEGQHSWSDRATREGGRVLRPQE
ncbi:MAG: recombinase RecT [Thermoleophilaceae bacterium]|nr:recombinase RecT [Thermoleophilaceae bacterium]